jgi:hypothetical protein
MAGVSLVGEDGAGVCTVCAKALALKDDIRMDVDTNDRARRDIKRVRPKARRTQLTRSSVKPVK